MTEHALTAMDAYVAQVIAAENAVIEQALELSLQQGLNGVKVQRDRRGRLVSAAPDAGVPYGEIHEHLGRH